MTTTALFVELLVIGAQAAIWLGLGVGYLFGRQWLNGDQNVINSWSLIISAVAFFCQK